jgi:hypothetical protein
MNLISDVFTLLCARRHQYVSMNGKVSTHRHEWTRMNEW